VTTHPALELMRTFYAAEADYIASGGADARSIAVLDSCLDPDVVLYQAPGLPFTGTGVWRGRAGLREFLDLFRTVWESMDVLEHRTLVDADMVVAVNVIRFRSRATHRTLTTPLTQVNRIKDGRVTEFRPYYWDPGAVVDVCGEQG
jgi:ketosteroid isomerase-like protein